MVANLGVRDVACMGQRSTGDGTMLGMLPAELVARERAQCTLVLLQRDQGMEKGSAGPCL